jgi:hypothetical protein
MPRGSYDGLGCAWIRPDTFWIGPFGFHHDQRHGHGPCSFLLLTHPPPASLSLDTSTMWNFSALAAKAQEAAARIERQLDDSVGIKDDTKSASASASTSIAAATHEEEDDDDNDDFFSEDQPSNHHHQLIDDVRVPVTRQHQTQQKQILQGNDIAKVDDEDNSYANDLGSDYLQDGDKPTIQPQLLPSQHSESEKIDEQVDFGGDNDMGTGDGWENDVDEIPLFDDENESSQLPTMAALDDDSAQVIESTISQEPESVAHMNEAYNTLSTAGNGVNSFSSDPCDEVIAPVIEQDYMHELKSSADAVQPPDNDHAEITVSNIDEEVTDGIIRDDYYIPESNLVINEPTSASDYSSSSQTQTDFMPSMDDTERKQFLDTIANLESQLYQREEQLASKSNQMASLSLQHESESAELRQAISNTKEEAKKRILRAKERVDEMQSKLTEAVRRADAAGGSSQEQSDIISELRAEGEKLAKKQSQMEQLVRNARGEARDLQEQLDIEKDARATEVAKVESLTLELKSVKEELTLARKGESQSKKLEADLLAAREESEKQRASNIGLEQHVKELRDENKTLKKEVQDARAGAALELEGESNKLRKERNDMLEDLENKLRTSEREANVREDALRHEVSELRKRWQDAVRRAEGK